MKRFNELALLSALLVLCVASATFGQDGFVPFAPPVDAFSREAGLDLRPLNEATAGDGGFITAKGSQFVHPKTGQPIRFWAVNGMGNAEDYASAKPVARLLAKRGVNLVRLHGAVFDKTGAVDPAKVAKLVDMVDACREQGIYTHLSIYFPLWMTPAADDLVLKGYDGKTHPFAALYFNPDFAKQYQSWWTAILNAKSPRTGRRLADEPAVFGVEVINEDSFFFWTFNDKLPDAQLRLIEKQFGDWAIRQYSSINATMGKWNNLKTPRDNPAEGRLGFRPLWSMFNERKPRDIDTARFLADTQKGFYADTKAFLRRSGFKGLITASNWITASGQYLGPIERYTYTVGDFTDRHGYFSTTLKGDNAAWSIRPGQTYIDRSALRFDPDAPGGAKAFNNPIFDITYNNLPSMLSETTFERPNRYRTEAPIFYAAYASLQDLDAVVHFALDGTDWNVKPGFWMQPWTLSSPAMMGQFPAAALIYRKQLIEPAEPIVELNLRIDDVLSLKGTPLAEGESLDELRLKDVPSGARRDLDSPIDPLVHLVGQVKTNFVPDKRPSRIGDYGKFIDRKARTVTASTGQLKLDYMAGLLTLRAPQAQGAVGNLSAGRDVDLPDLVLRGAMDPGAIVLVSLDGRPINQSGAMLLQVMSEEKATGFASMPAGGVNKITNIGKDPWMIRRITGSVSLKRPDANRLRVTPLDANGYRGKSRPAGAKIDLDADTIYYLIER